MMSNLHTETYIPVRWRLPIRILWILIALGLFTLYLAGLEPTYHELSTVCRTAECPARSIATTELALMERYGISLTTYVYYYLILEMVLILFFSVLAILVFWLRSDTWVGIVISLAFLFAALVFFSEENRALAR
ncbi:MAG: hypothetical protein KDE51_09440, partial [Anaerolineales bacterium]|nr:hypothetical protein [Anaerolineales bacterium]